MILAEPPNLALRARPLSARERADLDRLETTINNGREVFREVALALLEIRDRRLYRATHKTFEAYCRETLGHSRGYGNKFALAAKVIQECEAKGLPPPANESQARVMREQAREAARAAAGGPVRAKLPRPGDDRRWVEKNIAHQRPAVTKTAEIEKLIGKLRKLHAPHPWRARADELLTLYQETVLPWPTEG